MAEETEIWVEKYRPRELSEIVGQDAVVERLKTFVERKSLPHMLFAGPPGNGKTTAALCTARGLFGELWSRNFIELNASVAPETPILIEKDGRVIRTTFGELAEEYFWDDSSKYAEANFKILSIDKDYQIAFRPVSLISRHRVGKIAKIKYDGGSIRTSFDHSVITIDGNGGLVHKKVSELREGDLLISFKTTLGGNGDPIDLRGFRPQIYSRLKGRLVKNPKIREVFDQIKLNEELSWLFGLYLAEGCTGWRGETSGQVIFTVGYPEEAETAEIAQNIIRRNFGLDSSTFISSSGFDPTRKTSVQVRILNTQLARFFEEHFYTDGIESSAISKRVPQFIFKAGLENRYSFLKGYMGDGYGSWDRLVRYSSRSKENLVDVAWLGRLSGLETSCFKKEVRLVWKLPSYSYIRSELMPAEPLINFFEMVEDKIEIPFRRALRHQLYSKKSKRISKKTAKNLLEGVDASVLVQKEKDVLRNLLRLTNSPLFSVMIKEVEIEDYDDYVYDVSVPGAEMFWGGTSPILLHNSDERGIDTIRNRVKDYARTKPIGDVPYKLIYLDEADALTSDAQHALRRTMERYSNTCRFILAVNYSSKIIEPIQSRCAAFRFKRLTEKDSSKLLKRIAKGEDLNLKKTGIKAIIHASEGDLRRAINLLQAASALEEKIDEKVVYQVSSMASPEDVKEMMELAMDGKFEKARKRLLELLIDRGLSGDDVLQQIQREALDLDVPEPVKVKLVDKMGEFDFRLVEGANERIQLEAALAHLARIGNRLKS